jgi:hypothetical protein
MLRLFYSNKLKVCPSLLRIMVKKRIQIFVWVSLSALGQIALAASPAHAGNEAGSEIGAKATAPPVCVFSAVRALSAENMTFAVSGTTGAAIAFTEMIDQTSALLKPATINLAAYAICNMPHQLTVASTQGALLPENAGAEVEGPFLREIHYRATTQWGAQTLTLLANGADGTRSTTRNVPTAQKGDLTIEIRVDGSDNDLTTPVMEGHYSDTIRFVFGPQP